MAPELAGARSAIRVVFYTDAREYGGAETSLANLLGALDTRIEAVVAGTNRPVIDRIAAQRKATSVVQLPAIRGRWSVRAIAAHVRSFRQLRADVLHVNLNGPGESVWAMLAGLAVPGIRVVAVEHLPRPISRLRRRLLTRFAVRRLAAHVAVGQRAAREVARFIGISPTSMRTIPNGVPDVRLEPLPRVHDGFVIGSVGRLHAQKGYDVLLRALAQLPGVTLVLTGDGEEREHLVELAEQLGVSERVALLGWRDDARRQLTAFDVFVLPSRFEGLPLVIIEAMLAELPVVATDVGSVSELVDDGSTGILVPPEDGEALAGAIGALLADPARRRAMGRRGRERALESFTAGAMAAGYTSLYEEVID